ncbi:MAG: SCO family protein [Sphingomonadales bacterium]|nr:MAG: SCO family protein [Sphingomonadales bacterium]
MTGPRTCAFARGTALASLLALSLAAGIAGCSREPGAGNSQGGTTQKAGPGGPFKLVDTKGQTVTDQTLKGKPYAIFFGFTRCPDVCPTTMNRMALLHKKLGSEADKMNVVFVSVDPEHDKREDVASFLSIFDAPVIGLTGDAAELKRMEKAYAIYVERVPLPNGDYTIDHSAQIMLFDRNGQFVETMDSHEDEGKAVAQLQRLIRA